MYSAKIDLANPSATSWYREISNTFPYEKISSVRNGNDLAFLNVSVTELEMSVKEATSGLSCSADS